MSSVLAVEGSLCIIIHHSLHSGLMLEALEFQRFICKDLFIYFPTDPLNTPSPLRSNLCERFNEYTLVEKSFKMSHFLKTVKKQSYISCDLFQF